MEKPTTTSAEAQTTPDVQAKAITESPKKTQVNAPPMPIRALLGFAGLSLLVGFFLPWIRVLPDHPPSSGLDLIFQPDVGGTPPLGLLLLPGLGVILTVLSLMGFRFAAHTAIGVALILVTYATYVLFQLFIAHTAIGLWIVAGSIMMTLLLGVGSIVWARRVEKQKS